MSAPDVSAPDVSAPDVSAPARGLAAALEALLVVGGEGPLTVDAAARATGAGAEEVRAVLGALAREYDETGRGFALREVGGGWRLATRPEHADVVERVVLDGQTARLSQAALETLAVVAYRQPVTRARVSAVRGVGVDGVVRTLLARGLVTEVGTEPSTGAVLYGTTALFLERLGLASLQDLPDLAPLLPEVADVAALELDEDRA